MNLTYHTLPDLIYTLYQLPNQDLLELYDFLPVTYVYLPIGLIIPLLDTLYLTSY